MNLFAETERKNRERNEPLAMRMRPRSLDEFVGQEHFLGEGKLLRRMLLADRLMSAIFYGPPGVGKTSLARLIARHTSAAFAAWNAAACGIKEIRATIDEARHCLAADGQKTVLFLDEIHHFNRTQQDILLPDVEQGVIVLLGATTQNPFFALNAPLVSRGQVFAFEPLSLDAIMTLLRRAIADRERGYGLMPLTVSDDALRHWAVIADGDARRALNALEIAVASMAPTSAAAPIVIDRAIAEDSIQRKALVFDPTGDDHYDLASAYIKSLRASDPDAAIYWLARMLEAGEDPRFIVRRLVIFASEDIGNADPMSLMVATSALQAVQFVGLPECQLNLSQATLHLAMAPKSNACTRALAAAKSDVTSLRTMAVPPPLRDAHYAGAKRLRHGEGYISPHEAPATPSIRPTELGRYYQPTDRGGEAEHRSRLAAEPVATQAP